MKNIINLERALEEFELNAQLYVEGTIEANEKVANKAYDSIIESLKYLYRSGKILLLDKYLYNNNDGIRLFAATYLLIYNEKKSLKVLKEISNKKGIIGFDAEMVIKEWKAGNLKLNFD